MALKRLKQQRVHKPKREVKQMSESIKTGDSGKLYELILLYGVIE